MARRAQWGNVGYKSLDARASLGDGPVHSAIDRINKQQLVAATVMAHYTHTREATLPMLFRDDDLAKLRAVRGMVETRGDYREYPLTSGYLTIDYTNALVPAIEADILYNQPERIAPLLAYEAEVKAVHARFEELKAVLRWLNRNATPAAIRYLFPQAMKLVPDSPIWRDLQAVPSRYNPPPEIAAWTQAIKDAANTVASMALLPTDTKPRERGTMWLTFKAYGVALDPLGDPDKKHYQTDPVVYNI